MKDAFLVALISITLADYKRRNGINLSRMALICILLVMGLVTNIWG